MRSIVVAIVVVVAGAGCSDGDPKPTVAEVPTTTNPALAADLEPTPAPLSAEQIVAGLETAVGAADFCGLLRAIDTAEPDPEIGRAHV